MPGIDLTGRPSPEERSELPAPSNQHMAQLFEGVDKVVLKRGGVYENKAMHDDVVLVLTDKVAQLQALLEVDEHHERIYCMCLGDHAIELWSGDVLKGTIGYHHGNSIRYHLWNSDAILTRSEALIHFFADEGWDKPLRDREAAKQAATAEKVAEREWLHLAPRALREYINVPFPDAEQVNTMIADLHTQMPDPQQRIVALLNLFGKSSGFWTGYPVYEDLPAMVLSTYHPEEIINVYLASNRNYKTRRGLGRYLCSRDFKKIRNHYLQYISQEVIDDLDKCFAYFGDQRGINEVFGLGVEKQQAEKN